MDIRSSVSGVIKKAFALEFQSCIPALLPRITSTSHLIIIHDSECVSPLEVQSITYVKAYPMRRIYRCLQEDRFSRCDRQASRRSEREWRVGQD